MVITLQRKKCIGCNYCVEYAPEQFQMSKKDGKTVLINSVLKRGFHTVKVINEIDFDKCKKAQGVCPVKIITVKRA